MTPPNTDPLEAIDAIIDPLCGGNVELAVKTTNQFLTLLQQEKKETERLARIKQVESMALVSNGQMWIDLSDNEIKDILNDLKKEKH